jgi:predicted alpha/beta-hydrolase family hydrolase
MDKLAIAVDGKRTANAVILKPAQPNGTVVAYAPGAGSNIHDPFGKYALGELVSEGFTGVRMEFPYMAKRARAPDRTPVLEATWRAVAAEVRQLGDRLVLGGRSMGGRIASNVIAAGEPAHGLMLFAYPLHPPSAPDTWRAEHLPSIGVPVLFCSGTRDAFARPDELRSVAATMPHATLHMLDGADHGFAVQKGSGRTRESVWQEAVERARDWLHALVAS